MREPFEAHALWPTIGEGTSLLVHLAIAVAWLVVALTTVRRASPRASTLLVVATVAQVLLACASPAAYTAIGAAAARTEGPDAFLRLSAGWTILASILGGGLSALLLAGVAQLANASRRDAREG